MGAGNFTQVLCKNSKPSYLVETLFSFFLVYTVMASPKDPIKCPTVFVKGCTVFELSPKRGCRCPLVLDFGLFSPCPPNPQAKLDMFLRTLSLCLKEAVMSRDCSNSWEPAEWWSTRTVSLPGPILVLRWVSKSVANWPLVQINPYIIVWMPYSANI